MTDKHQFNEAKRALLIRLREEQNATQHEFAEIIGIKQGAYGMKEIGKREVSTWDLLQIFRHYKLKPEIDADGNIKVFREV